MAALVLSGFIFLIVVLTALIDTPTFLHRMHSTIIAWQLPLVAIGMIAYASVKEQGTLLNSIFRLTAAGLLFIAFLCTNLTKNIVQDVASNIENYVDVAEKTIKSEAENVKDYEKQLERAVEDANDKKNRRDRDWDEYDEEYYY
jgi:multisubunit Na+/H+ antiporter MnhG subunit